MSKYIAIIGDLINSKQIKDREKFQDQLKKTFQDISDKYKKSFVSKLTLTLGDEFQAILKLDENLLRIIDELYVNINHDFRLGIGYGQISTKIDPKISIGADGEAFWRARKAIEYVHDNNYQDRCNLYFIGFKSEFDKLINANLLLTETIKYEWTSLQRETFELMLQNDIFSENFNQQRFANQIKISESSLSKRLSSSNIKIYIHGRLALNTYMEANYE